MLQQVPLIKASFFNPPKPVKLPADYIQLPSRVPETRVTRQDLESWVQECETAQSDIRNYGKEDIEKYEKWNDRVVKQMAPGYIGGSDMLLTPQRKSTDKVTSVGESLSSLDLNRN